MTALTHSEDIAQFHKDLIDEGPEDNSLEAFFGVITDEIYDNEGIDSL